MILLFPSFFRKGSDRIPVYAVIKQAVSPWYDLRGVAK